jgi:hypothetical protein
VDQTGTDAQFNTNYNVKTLPSPTATSLDCNSCDEKKKKKEKKNVVMKEGATTTTSSLTLDSNGEEEDALPNLLLHSAVDKLIMNELSLPPIKQNPGLPTLSYKKPVALESSLTSKESSNLPPIKQNPGLPTMSYKKPVPLDSSFTETKMDSTNLPPIKQNPGLPTLSYMKTNITMDGKRREMALEREKLSKDIKEREKEIREFDEKNRKRPSLGTIVTEAKVDTSRLEQMTSAFRYATRIDSPALSELFLSNKLTMDACPPEPTGDDLCRDALAHLACHKEFYNLLEKEGIIAEIKQEMRQGACFIFVVPSYNILVNGLVPPSSDQLRYHVAYDPIDPLTTNFLNTMLPGKQIDYEEVGNLYHFNGMRGQRDKYYPKHIVHIDGLLQIPQGGGEGGGDIGDGADIEGELAIRTVQEEEDADLPPPTDLPPDLPPPTQQQQQQGEGGNPELPPPMKTGIIALTMPCTKLDAYCMGKVSGMNNHALKPVVEKLNLDHFSTPVDLATQLDRKTTGQHAVDLSLRFYNNKSLYDAYRKENIQDLARFYSVSSEQDHFEPKNQQFLTVGDRKMTVYRWHPEKKIHKSVFLDCLTEIQFNSPFCNTEKTILLTKFHSSPIEKNTFMTTNEAVIVRFQDNYLHTIMMDHQHQMPTVPAASVGKHHFLEFNLTGNKQALYHKKMDRFDFDQMMMAESGIKRFFRKVDDTFSAPFRRYDALPLVANDKRMNEKMRTMAPSDNFLTSGHAKVKYYDEKVRFRGSVDYVGWNEVALPSEAPATVFKGSNGALGDLIQRVGVGYVKIVTPYTELLLDVRKVNQLNGKSYNALDKYGNIIIFDLSETKPDQTRIFRIKM